MRITETDRDAARSSLGSTSYQSMLLQRRLERALTKVTEAPRSLPSNGTADEWAALSRDAVRLAAWRERTSLKKLLDGNDWRPEDIAYVLNELGVIENMFDTKPVQTVYMRRV
eukprot:6212425-Pleurochrysis_carterae.AAC.1